MERVLTYPCNHVHYITTKTINVDTDVTNFSNICGTHVRGKLPYGQVKRRCVGTIVGKYDFMIHTFSL